MAIPRATARNLGELSPSVITVCKTRTDLLDRLADALESLGRAKLTLETDRPNGDLIYKNLIRHQVHALRDECSSIRQQLETHRLSHGC